MTRASRVIRLCMVAVVVFAASILLAACNTTGGQRGTDAGGELRFRWVMPDGFPATVSLYRALNGQQTGETGITAGGVITTLGEPIPDGVLPVRLDEPQRVVLKVDNRRDTPLRFWVAPHLPQPHEGNTALMAQCLCTGAVYEIPAGGSWTRVLEFGIRRRGAVTPLSVTHVFVLGEPPK